MIDPVSNQSALAAFRLVGGVRSAEGPELGNNSHNGVNLPNRKHVANEGRFQMRFGGDFCNLIAGFRVGEFFRNIKLGTKPLGGKDMRVNRVDVS